MAEETTTERLAVIETKLEHIEGLLSSIQNKHLDAIYSRFNAIWRKFSTFETKLLTRTPSWVTAVITFLTSLCVGLIVWGVGRK